MARLTSPGVSVREIDLSTIVPSVSTTEAAFAGVFRWGPVDQTKLIDSEINLVKWYGKPTNHNPETWFTAASFLAYGNRLIVSRAADFTGNTITLAVNGNTTNLALESGNTSANVGNTTGLVAGQILLYADNTAISVGTTIVSVTNATHIVLSSAPTANVEDVGLTFRDDTVYSAAALQSDVNYNAGDVTDWDSLIVKSEDHYAEREATGDTFDLASLYVARYPGALGNSLRVSVCDSAAQYSTLAAVAPNAQFSNTLSGMVATVGSNTLTVTVTPADTANATEVATANAYADTLNTLLSVGDLIETGNTRVGYQYLKVTGVGAVANVANVYSFTVTADDEFKLSSNVTMTSIQRYWEFFNSADAAPGQ
jgi:hypothetical protein